MMTICINQNSDILEDLLVIPEDEVPRLKWDAPITHALVVARNRQGYLLLYNTWKKHWELPGGICEQGESLRECALREMLEETNQIPDRTRFVGLMKIILKNGKTEYGVLFSAYIQQERPFEKNSEAGHIVWWDGQSDIGYIDEIDRELLNYYTEP